MSALKCVGRGWETYLGDVKEVKEVQDCCIEWRRCGGTGRSTRGVGEKKCIDMAGGEAVHLKLIWMLMVSVTICLFSL